VMNPQLLDESRSLNRDTSSLFPSAGTLFCEKITRY